MALRALTSCSPRWLPGLPASVHISARSPYTIDVTTGSDPTPSPGEVTVASSWSAQRTSVGTAVARSSSTGQTSNPSSACTSALADLELTRDDDAHGGIAQQTLRVGKPRREVGPMASG